MTLCDVLSMIRLFGCWRYGARKKLTGRVREIAILSFLVMTARRDKFSMLRHCATSNIQDGLQHYRSCSMLWCLVALWNTVLQHSELCVWIEHVLPVACWAAQSEVVVVQPAVLDDFECLFKLKAGWSQDFGAVKSELQKKLEVLWDRVLGLQIMVCADSLGLVKFEWEVVTNNKLLLEEMEKFRGRWRMCSQPEELLKKNWES